MQKENTKKYALKGIGEAVDKHDMVVAQILSL